MTFTNSTDFLNYLQETWENEEGIIFDNEQEKWGAEFIQISKDRLKNIDPTKVSSGHKKITTTSL